MNGFFLKKRHFVFRKFVKYVFQKIKSNMTRTCILFKYAL